VSHAVVFDVNVLVGAVVGGRSDFESWPSPPPTSDNPFADCVGIANDAREFSLWLSDHILENVVAVLTNASEGFGWEMEMAEEYVDVLWDIAEAEPRERVNDCSDYEDSRILELALECDADLIVSDDEHLVGMSPWRGRPIVRPREFAARTDAMRRAERKPRRK
jgi:predicted nucleic acid-binding protein